MFDLSSLYFDLSVLIADNPWLPWLVLILLGAICGSFAACLAYRLPIMLEQSWHKAAVDTLDIYVDNNQEEPINMLRPGSFCPHCRQSISVLFLIPLLGYLFALGRCRNCKKSISPLYPTVELSVGLLFCWAYSVFAVSMATFFICVLVVFLVALSVIDGRTHLLPDLLVLPLLWLGLLVNYFGIFVDFELAFWGVVVGYGCFFILYWLFYWFTGRESLGRGDMKLLAMLGAWSGLLSIASIVFAASLLGLLWLLIRKMLNKGSISDPLAFGPSLIIAAWFSLLYGGDWFIDVRVLLSLFSV